jgi:hypothetical protein
MFGADWENKYGQNFSFLGLAGRRSGATGAQSSKIFRPGGKLRRHEQQSTMLQSLEQDDKYAGVIPRTIFKVF